MTKTQILDYLTLHKDEIFDKYGVVKIGLFGSYSRGEAGVNSDIDLLVEMENNVQDIYRKKCALKEDLENYFQKNVDIAREKYLKPLAKETILKDVIYV